MLLFNALVALFVCLSPISASAAAPPQDAGAGAPRELQATATPNPGAFSHPLQIQGLDAWFTSATAASTNCVTSWQSLGDAGVVGSAGGCPSFSSPTLNGYAPMRLAASQTMTFNEAQGATSWTLFYLSRIWGGWGRGLQSCNANVVMGCYNSDQGPNQGGVRSCESLFFNDRWWRGGPYQAYCEGWQLFSVVVTAASVRFYRNGIIIGDFGTNWALPQLCIGGPIGEHSDNDMADVVIYRRTLTVEEQQLVEGALLWKVRALS